MLVMSGGPSSMGTTVIAAARSGGFAAGSENASNPATTDPMRSPRTLLAASRIAWYGYTNIDQTLVGRVLGKDALGAYSFAVTFSTIAQQEVGAVVSRVVPGIFSEIQDQRAELCSDSRRTGGV